MRSKGFSPQMMADAIDTYFRSRGQSSRGWELRSDCPSPWWAQPLFNDAANGEDEDGNPIEPITINISGLTCKDFSMLGLQKRDAGVSSKEHTTYVATRKALCQRKEEHFYFSECAETYPTLQKQGPLASSHFQVSVRTGPEAMGFPTRRLRSFGAGVNRSTHVWVGPSVDKVQEDFANTFHRSIVLTGEVFLQASLRDIHDNSRALAAVRKKCLPEDFQSCEYSEYLDILAPPGVVMIKAEYEAAFAADTLTPPFFADLAHHPFKGPAHGAFIPVLDTHPKTFTWNAPSPMQGERFLLPSELLASLGNDVYPSLSAGRSLSSLPSLLAKHPLAKQLMMIGNSIHAPTLAAWIYYVLGNSVPLERFNAMPGQVPPPGDEIFEDPDADTLPWGN
jgi:hypothetical protein